VYLPTFAKSLTISGELNANTSIGVTSPIRNTAKTYMDNTFSPVAVASSNVIAENAWTNCNFLDDQGWFFVNGHRTDHERTKRTTYYRPTSEGKATNGNTLYFGWTWANVVRTAPVNFAIDDINSAEDMAWLVSKSAGMNGETATDFVGETIKQTSDIDLKQYVWVPIGTESRKFAGTFDGQGHLIDSLFIEYIGIGDSIYERNHYGLFGTVNNGSINRTFVVGGKIRPAAKPSSSSSKAGLDESYLPEAPEADTLINNEDNLENRGTADAAGPYNIGGLVGYLQSGTLSNSEAAITVPFVYNDSLVVGGLVGRMDNGTVHSSMAMPLVNEIHEDNEVKCIYLLRVEIPSISIIIVLK
jgi:hypothetical protein